MAINLEDSKQTKIFKDNLQGITQGVTHILAFGWMTSKKEKGKNNGKKDVPMMVNSEVGYVMVKGN